MNVKSIFLKIKFNSIFLRRFKHFLGINLKSVNRVIFRNI